MANIQAVGADGLTIVYLAASGTGEVDDPFVSRYDINGLDLLAKEASLLDAINKIPTFAYDAGRLLVKTELAQPLTDSQLRAGPIEVLLNSTAITNTSFGATQSGAWIVSVDNQTALTDAELRAAPITVTGDFYPSTQPISAVTLPLPTGAATETTLSTVNDKLPSLSGGRIPVESNHTQPLTDAQLRASVVNVSVSNLPATQPVSATSLPLPTGSATAANQTTLIGHVDGIEEALAGTISVNTHLNQPLTNSELRASAVPVSVGNFPATQAVSVSSLPLPVDAATESTLNSLNAKIPSPSSGRIPVDIGTVNIGSPVEVANDSGNPIPVSGSVSVSNFPTTQVVSGTVNTGLTQPLTDAQLRATPITTTLASESGYLTYRNTALSNTPSTVKVAAGGIYGWNFINHNTTPVYVKFYDTLSVILGSTTPIDSLLVPPGDGVTPGMFVLEPGLIPYETFSTAISIVCVTGLADNSTAAPSTPIYAKVRYK